MLISFYLKFSRNCDDQRNLPVKTRINLVKTLLMSHFCSAAEATLLKAFNTCVRFFVGLKRHDRTSEHLNDIPGSILLEYLDYRTCLFMFKLLLHTGEPGYLLQHLKRGTSARTCNLIIPSHKTPSMSSSFFVSGIAKRNSLPLSVRDQRTVWSFKRASRNHFSVG